MPNENQILDSVSTLRERLEELTQQVDQTLRRRNIMMNGLRGGGTIRHTAVVSPQYHEPVRDLRQHGLYTNYYHELDEAAFTTAPGIDLEGYAWEVTGDNIVRANLRQAVAVGTPFSVAVENLLVSTEEDEMVLFEEEEEETRLPTMNSFVLENTLHFSERLYDAILRASENVARVMLQYGETCGKGDYLDISSDGHISWRPLNRMEGAIENPYDIKGRVKGRPAKTLRSFLPQTVNYLITDSSWEEFANRFMTEDQFMSKEYQMLSGKDLVEAYHYTRYTRLKTVRPLMQSCMRYDFCAPYLDLYKVNPDQVKLMTELDREERITARALVWSLDSGETFMDRIYGDNYAIQDFRRYAENQGWLYRSRNGYEQPTLMVADGQERRRNRKVTLAHKPRKNQYPYLDTFLWYNTETNVLANNRPQATTDTGTPVQLRSTSGGFYRR